MSFAKVIVKINMALTTALHNALQALISCIDY